MNTWLKYMQIGGLTYTIIWSVIIYFIWDDAPEFFTWLDVSSGLIMIHLAFEIYEGIDFIGAASLLLQVGQVASLVYATIWTFVVMIFLQADFAELFLPFDAISLYVTIGLSLKIGKAIRRRYCMIGYLTK